MMNFKLYCAECGAVMDYADVWSSRLVKVLVCGDECRKKIETKYCLAIIESNAKVAETHPVV